MMSDKLGKFITDLKLRQCSEISIKTYDRVIKKFLKNVATPIDKNNAQSAIDDYTIKLVDDGLKSTTINMQVRLVVQYLKFNNIKVKQRWLKEPKRLPKALTEDEVNRIIDLAIGQDKLIIQMLYYCGLRVSELCNLKVKNIDKVERTINIIGKGNKERIVILNKKICQTIRNHIKEYNLSYDDYLFYNSRGNKLNTMFVGRLVKKYARIAQINHNVTPHMFRHSFATHLLNKGVNIVSVQQLLGHNSLEITQIYTQLSVNDLKIAYDKIDL